MIVRDLKISSPMDPDTLLVHTRGDGCNPLDLAEHDWQLETKLSDFTYKICGRCGTVRIGERHS